ncbi:molybdenum cofactor guanylyltransferase [Plantactinospora sp. GCM10030261]|uniref:molybdenum cofactor guanylyltransferase n=1 Tax=Plantactinospora sp. GCM10030261 TaxID=3273420 RepID=UPI00360B0C37
MRGYAAVVLAGGAARRMGGVDKPAMLVGGRPMRDRVLAAVADAAPRIVVGPGVELPSGVLATREEPAGGGPVAALAAGLAHPGLAEAVEVAVLAADLPLLTSAAVTELRRALAADGALDPAERADGACFRDETGRRQHLCGVWRVGALRRAVATLTDRRGGALAGASMRMLIDGLVVREVSPLGGTASGSGAPPWFDCDTDDDVRRAEEWVK